jgi:hypothetical protein
MAGSEPSRWAPFADLLGELQAGALALGLLTVWADSHVPPQDLPWRPLSLDQPVGVFTRAKLNAVLGEGCRAKLTAVGVDPHAEPDRGERFCLLHDVVRPAPTRLSPAGPMMVCRQAAAYVVWERQVAAPAALRLLGSPLRRVAHFGTYACRRQYGASTGPVSEHASADAIDVAAFVLADGRRIDVAVDWADRGQKGRFLHEVRDGACRVFDVTLSPDYNTAHHDHLHLDMGPFRTCG